MAYTTINKSSEHFNTKLYTGNGSTQSITGVGFQPDFLWIKERSSISSHTAHDAVRGATKYLTPNTTDVEGTGFVTSFNSDGFTLPVSNLSNQNNETYASWNWKANGAGSANTVGSINSTVSVNTTAGFSIVTYTGNGVSGATVGHGLGVAPKMIMVKCLNSAHDWAVFHKDLTSNNYFLVLNENNAQASGTTKWQDTDPSSTVFTLGNGGGVNANTQTHVAYCFADVQGFSKMGSYIGNGNADGTFVYTGFKPAFVMMKCTDSARSWQMHNNKSNPANSVSKRLFANLSDAEADNTDLDFLSNGFKPRTTDLNFNGSGNNYIYMAFAEAPLVGTNGVTAKAR